MRWALHLKISLERLSWSISSSSLPNRISSNQTDKLKSRHSWGCLVPNRIEQVGLCLIKKLRITVHWWLLGASDVCSKLGTTMRSGLHNIRSSSSAGIFGMDCLIFVLPVPIRWRVKVQILHGGYRNGRPEGSSSFFGLLELEPFTGFTLSNFGI